MSHHRETVTAEGAPKAAGPYSHAVKSNGILLALDTTISQAHGAEDYPAANRWFSRDVQAISTARGVPDAAPFFVDADAAPRQPRMAAQPDRAWPQGGLTVIAFHNNHLVYALTWYALALMSLFAAWRLVRDGDERSEDHVAAD